MFLSFMESSSLLDASCTHCFAATMDGHSWHSSSLVAFPSILPCVACHVSPHLRIRIRSIRFHDEHVATIQDSIERYKGPTPKFKEKLRQVVLFQNNNAPAPWTHTWEIGTHGTNQEPTMAAFHMDKSMWHILSSHRGPKLCTTNIENCNHRTSQPPSRKAFPRTDFFAKIS